MKLFSRPVFLQEVWVLVGLLLLSITYRCTLLIWSVLAAVPMPPDNFVGLLNPAIVFLPIERVTSTSLLNIFAPSAPPLVFPSSSHFSLLLPSFSKACYLPQYLDGTECIDSIFVKKG